MQFQRQMNEKMVQNNSEAYVLTKRNMEYDTRRKKINH